MKRVRIPKSTITLAMVFLLVAGVSPSLYASEGEEEQHEEHGHKWAIGLFIGLTRAHSDNESTLGIELERILSPKWSIAGLVERADRNEDSTLLMALVGWRPWRGLTLQLGAGRKDPGNEREVVYRTGMSYEFELAPTWVLKPYIAVDFIQNEEDEEVFGFYIGKLF